MKLYLASFLLFIVVNVFAQTKDSTKKKARDFGIVIGNIVDATTSKGIAYATVQLQKSIDTTQKHFQVTDKNGAFEFEKIPFSYYRLIVIASGYKKLILDSIHVRDERFDFNLGDVKLNIATNNLDEVIVYAEKPLIENKDGKITYNVGESALSNTSSTSEILKNMPLINNDPNGKILLKGKEPKILIDDKPTDLTAEQLKDLLESLPGSSIEKIELMTNPPPQYATESGGVINIVTKKGKIGFTGKTTLSFGTRGEATLANNLSYRNKKFTLSSIVGLGASLLNGNSHSTRTNFYADSTNSFKTVGEFKNRNLRPNFRLQADYELTKQQSINITYQGNLNYFKNKSQTQYTNINKLGEAYKYSSRSTGSDGNGYSHGFTISYALKGKNIAEVLRIIANANLGKNDNDRDYYQQYLTLGYVPQSDSSQNQLYDNLNNNFSLRINYDKPLKKKGTFLSSGISFLRSNNHNVLNTSFYRKLDSTFVANDLLSSNFKFHQNIVTARASILFTLKKEWKLTIGAQIEQTQMNFDFVKGNTNNVKNTYTNILPTVNIRKDFSKQLNTSFVYRATIRRPGLGELNPNIDYTDPYNLRFGNPFLLPTLSHNFDFNVSLIKGKYYFNTSVGYNKVTNIINTIKTLVDAGKTQTTWQNIASRNEYEASIWGGYTFTKKFRVNTSAGYTYNNYTEQEKKLYKYIDGGTFYTSINYNYTPTTLLTFEGNIRYSSFSDPQGRSKSNLMMNLGVQRKFLNKRLLVSLNIIDPFKVQQFITNTYGTNFTIESYNYTQTKNVRLAVSYQLNKIVQKSKVSTKQKADAINKIKQPKK